MKILLLSEGPPPLGSTVAEGGALRTWGIAKGLLANGCENVTLAYRSTFALADDADTTTVPQGLNIVTWDGESLSELLAAHNVIIMRYAMGEAWEITRRLTDQHILVADSYVPISVEVSARNSRDKDEAINYLRLQKTSAKTMKRADYILYASHSQLIYYLGYLGGINKLNPTTYSTLQERMFELPYGVDSAEKPILQKQPPHNLTLLWYGAFYSWFDMSTLIPALTKLRSKVPGFKLLVAGAKNPYNTDPGLLAHYEKTVEDLKVLGEAVEYIPWTSFDERFDIYSQGSAIITYNHLGLENEVAWRTRLMDFVLADRPILTNGGDPLGEDLIKRGIAYRIEGNNLEQVINEMVQNPPTSKDFKKVADDYSWVRLTSGLAKTLQAPSRLENGILELSEDTLYRVVKKTVRIAKKPVSAMHYLKKQGIKATIKLAKDRLRGK